MGEIDFKIVLEKEDIIKSIGASIEYSNKWKSLVFILNLFFYDLKIIFHKITDEEVF